MSLDYAQLALQAIDLVQNTIPHAATAAALELTFKEAGERGVRLLHLLKGKFTKPAAAGALAEALQQPAVAENWDVLRLQIIKALKEDETFREKFLDLFPANSGSSTHQSIAVAGNDNVPIQIAGHGNQTSVGQQ